MKEQIHGGDVYRHPGVLDFSANMNPLGTPVSVIQAAQQAVTEICNYPDVHQERLLKALSDYEEVPKESLICGNGAAELIFMLAQGLKPKKAVLLAPTFAEYELALRSVDCEISYVPLYEEEGFALESCKRFLEAVVPGTDLVCLCNPNNPTGRLISRDTILKILDHCKKCNCFVLLDECFNDFLDEPRQYTLKHQLEQYPNLFLMKAFTKRYSMAGIRLGYGMCSDPAFLDKMKACVQPWNLSVPAQAAGVAALQEESYVQKAREIVRKERNWLKEELGKRGLKIYDSQANYIFFRGPKGLVNHCLKSQVLIRDCGNYVGLEDGYYRVAVKLHSENEKLLEALNGIDG